MYFVATGMDVKQEPIIPQSVHIPVFESFPLAPFIAFPLLTGAECLCGFTEETPAFFQRWECLPCGLCFKLFQLQTCNLRTSPVQIKAVSATAHSTVKIQLEPRISILTPQPCEFNSAQFWSPKMCQSAYEFNK